MLPQALARPPIVFASLEIKFNPHKDVELARLEEYAQSLSPEYSKLQNIETKELSFGTTEKDNHFQNIRSQRRGFQVATEAGNRSIRVEIDAYAVAFHGGYYPPWPAIKDFFLENLQPYLEVSRQYEISRIGLRIVNRLVLSFDEQQQLNFSEFIQTDISLPKSENFPDGIAFFNTDATVPFGDGYFCRIKQQSEQPQENSKTGEPELGFILDTDASCTKTLKVDAFEEFELIFERLREIKNMTFFGSFTDKALEKYV